MFRSYWISGHAYFIVFADRVSPATVFVNAKPDRVLHRKSATIALMQRAKILTRSPQAAGILREGITTTEVELITAHHGSGGGSTFCIVLFGSQRLSAA